MTAGDNGTPTADTGSVRLEQPGLIWITGYSGAGKTTVARCVEPILRDRVASTIALDGDDLRRVFGGGWGYERADRVALAHVYFRLARHLTAQGAVVLISAVAMFEEVREWVQTNVPNSFLVYLDVPHHVRLERDAHTKHVYAKADVESLYDEPTHPDLRIENYGDRTPEDAAHAVVESYLLSGTRR